MSLKVLKAPVGCFHSTLLPHSWAQPPNFSATPQSQENESLFFPRFNRRLLCLPGEQWIPALMHVFIQRQLYFSMLRIFSEGFHKPWFSDIKIPNAATVTNVTHLNGLYPQRMKKRNHFKFNFQWKVTKLLPKFLVSVGKFASQKALGIGLNHLLVGAPTAGTESAQVVSTCMSLRLHHSVSPGSTNHCQDGTELGIRPLQASASFSPDEGLLQGAGENPGLSQRDWPPCPSHQHGIPLLSLSCASKELGYRGCLSACLSSLFSEKQSGRGEK